MYQPFLFDIKASEARKHTGMAVAASNRNHDLELARGIARELCRKYGSTDADAVGRLMQEQHGVMTLGPAAGSIFKSGDFEWTGEYRKSKRKTNHARMLRVWKLKED